MAARANSEFTYSEGEFEVTDDMKKAYNVNGYLILRDFLNKEEHGMLKTALENDADMKKWKYGLDDGDGKKFEASIWSHPGNDITGAISRSEKLAGTMEKLMGGEVYHYHSKVIMKPPNTGGVVEWHQDYGYWYENGYMFPNMATAWIAVDRATGQNGCVELLVGSHQMGRINHIPIGDQMGADPVRVAGAKKVCPHMSGEMNPGDCMIFHCNVLHTSAQNKSDQRRWGFLSAYNRASNNPVHEHHLQYTKLVKLPNSAIKEAGTTTTSEGKDYFVKTFVKK